MSTWGQLVVDYPDWAALVAEFDDWTLTPDGAAADAPVIFGGGARVPMFGPPIIREAPTPRTPRPKVAYGVAHATATAAMTATGTAIRIGAAGVRAVATSTASGMTIRSGSTHVSARADASVDGRAASLTDHDHLRALIEDAELLLIA